MSVPAEAALMYPRPLVRRPRHRAEVAERRRIRRGDRARRSGGAIACSGRGAAAIMVIGTSLTFYRGAAFNRRLIGRTCPRRPDCLLDHERRADRWAGQRSAPGGWRSSRLTPSEVNRSAGRVPAPKADLMFASLRSVERRASMSARRREPGRERYFPHRASRHFDEARDADGDTDRVRRSA